MRVIRIDAWAYDDGWYSNDERSIGTVDLPDDFDESAVIAALEGAGYLRAKAAVWAYVEIDHDYATVLDRTDGYRPVMAVELSTE
jgi:hypothetical protein